MQENSPFHEAEVITTQTTPIPDAVLVYEAQAVPATGAQVAYVHGLDVREPRTPIRVQVMDDRKKVWTYEWDGEAQVGQIAICPDGRFPEVSWLGQVVGIGSPYQGKCKRLRKVLNGMDFKLRLRFETAQKAKKAFMEGERAAVVWQDLIVRTSTWKMDEEYVTRVKETVCDVLWGLRAKKAPAITKDDFIAELEATKPK